LAQSSAMPDWLSVLIALGGFAGVVSTAVVGLYTIPKSRAEAKRVAAETAALKRKRDDDDDERDARTKELIYNMLTDTVKGLREQLSDSEVATKALRSELTEAIKGADQLRIDITRAHLRFEELKVSYDRLEVDLTRSTAQIENLNGIIGRLHNQLIAAGIEPCC